MAAAAKADEKSLIVPSDIEGKVLALQALEDLVLKLTLECKQQPLDQGRCQEKIQVVYELTLPLISELAEYQNDMKADYLNINKAKRDFISDDIMSQTFGTPSLLEQYRAGSRSANAVREYEALPNNLKIKYQMYLKTPVSVIEPPGGIFSVASASGGRAPRRGGRRGGLQT